MPATTHTLQILGRPDSINVRKVLWTCRELGLPFELDLWGSGHRSPRAPEFLALNPHGMVPVLRDRDIVLWESNTICRYLAARERRDDLLPGEAAPRALVERWMDWQVAELNNAWRYAFRALVRQRAGHVDASAIEASVAAWTVQMNTLESVLARGGDYVAGAGFTLADVVIGLSVHRWLHTPIVRPELPAVVAYYGRLRERPAFRDFSSPQVP
jgi:glutathione S-transferase